MPVVLFGQAVSRTELRATNDLIQGRILATSNALYTLQTNGITISSNSLYQLISSSGVTTPQFLNASNILRRAALPTNTVLVTDYASIQAAWNANPSDTLFLVPKGTYSISATITNPYGAHQCWFLGTSPARADVASTWTWAGVTNGTLLKLDCADGMRFENIDFETPLANAASKLVVVDQTAMGGGTMTDWQFKNCMFRTVHTDPLHSFIAMEVSPTSASNCERGQWIDCNFYGFGAYPAISNRSFGMVFGNSANSLLHKIQGCSFNYFTNAVSFTNGSASFDNILSTGNGVEIAMTSAVDFFKVNAWRGELSRQFFVLSGAVGGSDAGISFDNVIFNDYTSLNTNFPVIQLDGKAFLSIANCQFAAGVAPLQPMFSLTGSGLNSQLTRNERNLWTTNDNPRVIGKFSNFAVSLAQDITGYYHILKAPLRWSDQSFATPSNLLSLNTNTLYLTVGEAGWTVGADNLKATNNVQAQSINSDGSPVRVGGNLTNESGLIQSGYGAVAGEIRANRGVAGGYVSLWYSGNKLGVYVTNGSAGDFPAYYDTATGDTVLDAIIGFGNVVLKHGGTEVGRITSTGIRADAFYYTGGGNARDANGNIYITNSTGIDGGGSIDVASASLINTGRFVLHAFKTGNGTIAVTGTNSFTIATNDNFTLTAGGTGFHGQRITGLISNYDTAANSIAVTLSPSMYSVRDSMLTNTINVPSNSVVSVRLWYDTNLVGSGQWFIETVQPEYALVFGPGVFTTTNNSTRTVTIALSLGVSNQLWFETNITAIAGIGGANTNFVVPALGAKERHLSGATNVCLLPTNGIAGQSFSGVLLITNRTATPRPVSLDAAFANANPIGSLALPYDVTNAVWLSWRLNGTNFAYALRPCANPPD